MRAFAQAPSAESSTRGNRSTFPFGVLAAMLVCAAAFLGIGAPAASAAPEASPAYAFTASFDGGEGYFYSRIRNPIGLDSNGNVFVVDENTPVVRVFEPDPVAGGLPLTTVSTPGLYVSDIAIDPSSDALYAQSAGSLGEPTITRRYTSDAKPSPAYTEDPGFEVASGEGIAVDPTTGDLLIADGGAESIRRYSSAGALLDTIATSGIAPQRIAVAGDGSIYVTQESSPSVFHLSSIGTQLGEIGGVGEIRAITVDPSDGRLVALADGLIKVYSATGTLLGESSGSSAGVALAIDGASGRIYEFTTDSGTVNVYDPVILPGVEAPVVSMITGHSAHVSADVEPGEENPGETPAGSEAHFEYSADGGLTWDSTPDQELKTPGAVKVEAEITGLLANFNYEVRVVVSNDGVQKASDATPFTTAEIAPEVETSGATGLGETTATLIGAVNPNGLQTTYHFEYGTTTSYGSRVPANIDAVAGNQRTSRSFSNSVSGLTAGTTYHYRIVAESPAGESFGADRTFTTAGAGEAAPARAYELVTPVDKRGAQVANDLRFQAAPGGSAIAVNVSAGPSDGESALIRQSYVMWRGADGWSDWVNADPPLAAEAGAFEASTMAISEDFTQSFVASNRVLAPGGIAGGGNLYVKDLKAGTYTFVGAAPGANAYASLVAIQQSIFAAAAPDFSWILFWSDAPLVPGAEGRGLYRWSREDGLSLESRLPDGSIPFFFFSVSPLTVLAVEVPIASADGSLEAFDLNKYEVGGVYIRKEGQSIPISVSKRAGDSPDAQPGTLEWVTPDGRYVFFHSYSQLTENTPPPNGSENLYRYDTETGDLLFIAPVGPSLFAAAMYGASDDGQTVYFDDGVGVSVWHEGAVDSVTPDRVHAISLHGSYTTDNGRYFAWVGSDDEAHLYDVETGDSACVSCPTSGKSLGLAHIVPSSRGLGNISPRGVLEDGTMFFDTPNPLLPADHNSTQDVYSYKDGYLTLISPGNARFGATFVDASEDGKDVYFQTEQGILPQDVDGSFDVYDARVGGGFPQSTAKAACSGEGCRGPLGSVPGGPSIGSTGSEGSRAPAISSVKPLNSAERAKLAKGRKVNLKLEVSLPGKVEVIGSSSVGRVISALKQAKQPGAVRVPIKLSKKGRKELNRRGSLAIRLTVSLGGEGQKVLSFTLKPAGGKKGGSS